MSLLIILIIGEIAVDFFTKPSLSSFPELRARVLEKLIAIRQHNLLEIDSNITGL